MSQESWGTIGLQVLLIVGVAGAVDLLSKDAVTAARADSPSPVLDVMNNMLVILVGGCSFVFLVGVS